MSVNLFGMVEIRDRETGKWEYAPLYRKDKSGEYREVDMFRGQRTHVGLVFGQDPFDNSEEYIISRPLDAIADIISAGRNISLNELSDKCQKKLGLNFEVGSEFFVCYTGQDIKMIGVLAEQVSKDAYNSFNIYFGNIVAVLDVVGTSYNIHDSRKIRAILYAV